ncbi:MAG: hypothetical protein KAI64_06325 [Thermoplasmata archaeon]|nr:hypothetical protein [Thermoplasmata archaeon]
MRIKRVKASRKDWGNCRRCGDPIPKGSAYIWITFRHGAKIVRCTKPSCRFRGSDLTQSDKIATARAASENIEDAVGHFVAEVHVSEILSGAQDVAGAVEEAKGEIEEAAEGYNESADNIEMEFDYSPTAEECREKAQMLESWAYEFDSPLGDLQTEIDSLDEYVSALEAREDEVTEDTDIIVTTVEGLTDMMLKGDEDMEPFDTSAIENAISEIEDMASQCPL